MQAVFDEAVATDDVGKASKLLLSIVEDGERSVCGAGHHAHVSVPRAHAHPPPTTRPLRRIA